MRAAVILLSVLSVSACARISSLGSGSASFGSIGSGARAGTQAPARPLIPAEQHSVAVDNRQLAGTITTAEITPGLSGPILRVQATTRIGGGYNAELISRGRDGDQLVFELRLAGQADQGNEPRDVTAVRVLDPTEMLGIRAIRVVAASNARVLRP